MEDYLYYLFDRSHHDNEDLGMIQMTQHDMTLIIRVGLSLCFAFNYESKDSSSR